MKKMFLDNYSAYLSSWKATTDFCLCIKRAIADFMQLISISNYLIENKDRETKVQIDQNQNKMEIISL